MANWNNFEELYLIVEGSEAREDTVHLFTGVHLDASGNALGECVLVVDDATKIVEKNVEELLVLGLIKLLCEFIIHLLIKVLAEVLEASPDLLVVHNASDVVTFLSNCVQQGLKHLLHLVVVKTDSHYL